MKRPLDSPNLGVVARKLVKHTEGRRLVEVIRTKTHEEHLVLCAPATLARCVDHEKIEKPDHSALKVLVINKRMIDFLDEGQWFRYAPMILDKKLRIQVIANTLDPESARESRVPRVVNRGPKIFVGVVEGSVGKLMERYGTEFDIAISFGNLISSSEDTMSPIKSLARAGVPIYLCDTTDLSGLMNRTVARAWGLEAELVDSDNKFGLVEHRRLPLGERWGSVISRIAGPVNESTQPDKDDLDSLTLTASMMLDSLKNEHAVQLAPIGGRVNQGSMIHTMDGLAVTPTGEVHSLFDDKKIGQWADDHMPWIASYDESWNESDRFIWAAYMKYFWGLWAGKYQDTAAA